jgi:hypothetical protein
MEQFNLNDFYSGVSRFWDSIAPIIIVHVIALLALKWIMGEEWHLLEKIEFYLNSDRYKRWRRIFDEFDLRPKAFFVVLVGIFFYFALFNNALEVINGLPQIRFSHSEWDMMRENRPIFTLVEIASYGTTTDVDVYDVFMLKQRFVYEYEAKYPDRYVSHVNWFERKFSLWFKYYLLSIIFLLFALIVFVRRLLDKSRLKPPLFKHIILLLFSLMMIVFSRYQAEQYTEKKMYQETGFVTSELRFDTSKKRLSDEEIQIITNNLYSDLLDPRPPDIFWLSRYLEYLPFVERRFPAISNEEFEQQYGHLPKPTQTP